MGINEIFKGRLKTPKQKHSLSVCAIIKDEGPYLEEWIEFHKLIGVDHFYIYDNDSTDNTCNILDRYIHSNTVTYIFWPDKGQIDAYNDCLTKFGQESNWIAFIDIDEFIFGTQKDDLREILKDYQAYPALGINWICFGSNGHKEKQEGLVIERFTKRSPLKFGPNRHVKMIVQPGEILSAGLTPHYFKYKNNQYAVTENFEKIDSSKNNCGSLTDVHSSNKIRINHYLVKSAEEFEQKLKKGRVKVTTVKDKIDYNYFNDHDKNDEEDLSILRFCKKLKLNIQSEKNFNWVYYLNKYPDLQKAGITTEQNAIKHYKTYGISERRIPNLHTEVMINLKTKISAIFLEPAKNKNVRNYPMQKNKNYKYYLSIGAVFKDCGPYIKEWLEYHRLVGVDHFYLYNNYSSDNYREILEPYILEGIVDLIDWNFETKYSENLGRTNKNTDPLAFIQKHAMNDCILYRAKYETMWLAAIDLDEFIVPKKEDNLKNILKEYEDYGGLVVSWQIFGTSNVKSIGSNELMVEKLTYSQPESAEDSKFIKSIIQTNRIVCAADSHYYNYKEGFFAVNSDKERHNGSGKTSNPKFDKLMINHYFYRDEEHFIKIKARQRNGLINKLSPELVNLSNSVYNPSILRFIPQLKQRVFAKTIQPTVPHNFNWEFYVSHYPDLKKAGINTKEKAENHYLIYGKKEGRVITQKE